MMAQHEDATLHKLLSFLPKFRNTLDIEQYEV